MLNKLLCSLFTFSYFLVFFQKHSFASKVYTKDASYLEPVNNARIAIPPFPENNPNNYRSVVREATVNSYRVQDGSIRDDFISYDQSEDYVKALPNSGSGYGSYSEVEKAKRQKIADPDSMVNEYFVMRKRVLAPTMRK